MQSPFSTIISQLLIATFHFMFYYYNAKESYALINVPKDVRVPAVLVFGDSIVDPGNNNYMLTICKCDFPPYGKDFEGSIATGRFSNGKVASDFIDKKPAEELGIKELVPAYLDPTLTVQDLLTGGVKSLTGQLELFEEYKQRLNAAVGAERASIIVSESMYFVVTGTDDFTTSYYNLPFRRPWYNTSACIDLLINHSSSFLQSLYDKGARRIGVLNMPPTGSLPSQRTELRGLPRHCVEEYNAAAILFNSKLLSLIHLLNGKFPDARFVYLDLYHPLLHLINNPHQSGTLMGATSLREGLSNGRVPSDFLAEELGIKEFMLAYLDPTLGIDDLLTGVNFASGCSGYDPVTATSTGIWRCL
ncbi:hypothetical protein Ancab_026629 [Ancistrocladus abbreviatus]